MEDRISARIAALEAELEALKQRVAEESRTPSAPTADRRGMVKLLAAGAVGAVTGAAMLGAKPAAAANASPILIGQANNGTTVTALSTTGDSALSLFGGPYAMVADGLTANALFLGSGSDPLGTGSGLGELYVDANGDWWAAVDTSVEGTWRKLAGPGTAGQLHILPTPVRVYDSRPGQPPNIPPKTPTVGNAPLTLFMNVLNSGVPNSATAVLITLTITGPTKPGFAAVWPSGAWPGTSNINFAAGQSIATTTVSGCGPQATIQVLSNTVTDFLVDVIGYYL